MAKDKTPKNASETLNEAAAAEDKVTRSRTTKRTWLALDKETKDPREATGLRLDVIDGGTIEAYVEEFADPVRNALAVFGLNIVLTNTLGGKKGADAYDAAMSRLETLQAGEWSERGGPTGPRISQLAQAMVDAFAKAGKMGKDGAPVTLEKATKALQDGGEEYRAKVAAQPAIGAELKRIQREAAEKREAEAAKKAEGSSLDVDI